MRILSGQESIEAFYYINEAAKHAKLSGCDRHHCGSVVVSNKEIIGRGFNSPPGNLQSQKRCRRKKNEYDIKVTDKTCCVHAEHRAIFDALRNNPKNINGSRLYFIRLDAEGNITKAGKPYCTICSKLTLDSGIKEFVLLHEEGICVYGAEEYNDVSFEYKK